MTGPRRAGTIASVAPRFGPDVVGGSEAVMREAATGLAARGWDVEVLTTRARDHYTWADAYPPGTSVVDGVTVRRFELVREEGRYPGQAEIGRASCGARACPYVESSVVAG